MRRLRIMRLDVPYRERLCVDGFEFGGQDGPPTCSVVGQMRGDEVQQAYTCASIVDRLRSLEERGCVEDGARILVIPCANPISMNVASRFWPTDGSDVNRSFPGDAHGSTTDRVAAGIFEAVRGSTYGIQMASFNQRGDFLPHVRVTRAGSVSEDALKMALDFRMPCVVARDPMPFDKGTLNFCWQECGTYAFSLYGTTTERIDRASAARVTSAVVRFLARHDLVRVPATGGTESAQVDEADLVGVRTERSAGYLEGHVRPGDRVGEGQELGLVRDAFDAHVLERLVAPVAGRVFFCRTQPLVQQQMVVYRIAPMENVGDMGDVGA